MILTRKQSKEYLHRSRERKRFVIYSHGRIIKWGLFLDEMGWKGMSKKDKECFESNWNFNI